MMEFSLLLDGIGAAGGIPEEARWRLCNAAVGRRQMQMPGVRASSVENRRTACGELECILHAVAKGAGLGEELSIGEAKRVLRGRGDLGKALAARSTENHATPSARPGMRRAA